MRTTTNPLEIEVAGRRLPIRLRRNRRARRIILRLEKSGDGLVVTLPTGVSEREALQWTESQGSWIAKRLREVPERVPFADGAVIPLHGEDVTIKHLPQARRGVWRDDRELLVSGRPEHLARRVRDWFKSEARRHIVDSVSDTAGRLGADFGRITVRDTRSRWGSCAANGNLNFCWRLIMAPAFVLEYVIAHEVAHLREANHGPEFWRLVESLNPHTAEARAWLKDHGESLHFYG